MQRKKIELELDEKPIERKPSLSCPRTDCRENLFGYCQTLPDLEIVGDLFKCKTLKIRG